MHGVLGSTLDPVNFHKPLDNPDIIKPSLLFIISDCMFLLCQRVRYILDIMLCIDRLM